MTVLFIILFVFMYVFTGGFVSKIINFSDSELTIYAYALWPLILLIYAIYGISKLGELVGDYIQNKFRKENKK